LTGKTPPQLITATDKDEVRPKATQWDSNFRDIVVYIKHIIGYWSRLLKSTEKNYSPTEKEVLALCDGLVKFQPIIKGEVITAITDHSALTWNHTFQNVNRRLRVWNLTYPAFPLMKIMHHTGRIYSNINPVSQLRQWIPFFHQPASNDPSVDLSQEMDINFYSCMK
jgi:hypothetical protein